ncbi:MAG: Hsp33 family molecular chaperone [Hyphomicrobiales bacterium]|nr:Hsp33 family molecular chaperone [Hyphomicrobiales bacterium]
MPDDINGLPDDLVLPFQIESSGARGRILRIGPAITNVLEKHDYPEPVSTLLGEAMVLTAMLGAALKFDGKFILQTSGNGPVSFLVAHYYAPGMIRGYASYDADALADIVKLNGAAQGHHARLLGEGHLAMTIDQGPDLDRYQGVVPLEGNTLSEAADLYFQQSEQLPTFIRIAVARQYEAGRNNEGGSWSWRAGGLLLQKLTDEGGARTKQQGGEPDEAWNRAQMLVQTVEDHELLDPQLPSERLLYRLFHEEQVRVFDPSAIEARCQCSRDGVKSMLASFTREEISDMAKNGRVEVKCEFCNSRYDFEADEILADNACGHN